MTHRTIVLPTELDNARVLAYAMIDKTVRHNTERSCMIVGDKVLGRVPRLVIAQNNHAPHDILLFYCNSKWRVLAAAGYKSVTDAKRRAEVEHIGSMSKWQRVTAQPLNNPR
jgi:hypothetical protein